MAASMGAASARRRGRRAAAREASAQDRSQASAASTLAGSKGVAAAAMGAVAGAESAPLVLSEAREVRREPLPLVVRRLACAGGTDGPAAWRLAEPASATATAAVQQALADATSCSQGGSSFGGACTMVVFTRLKAPAGRRMAGRHVRQMLARLSAGMQYSKHALARAAYLSSRRAAEVP